MNSELESNEVTTITSEKLEEWEEELLFVKQRPEYGNMIVLFRCKSFFLSIGPDCNLRYSTQICVSCQHLSALWLFHMSSARAFRLISRTKT